MVHRVTLSSGIGCCPGMQVASFVVTSFTAPTGMITAIYIWAILQIVGCYQIYCRPTFGFAYNYVIRYGGSSSIGQTTHKSLPRPDVSLIWMKISLSFVVVETVRE